MNSIEALKRDIERALAGVETKLTKPRKETGHWWLDARYNGHAVAVEWSPRRGFGVSTIGPDEAYGEGPDEVFSEKDTASKRVIDLLAKGTRSLPPSDVVLRELRAAVGFTQDQLANRLGVQQAAVSRLERRSDITLRSLRRYVEALGGELEINVRTPDGECLNLLEGGKKANARAACEHALESWPESDVPTVPEPNVAYLSRLASWLGDTARARWTMSSQDNLLLRDDPRVELATACVERGTISVNTHSMSRLASLCSSVAATMSSARVPTDEAVYRYILGHEIGHFVYVDAFADAGCPKKDNSELRADLIAGWLAGLAGDEPTAGSVVTSLLGCRRRGCSHPTPEQRTFAFLSGHSRGATELARTAAQMKLLVLRVADLELSKAFYSGLGLQLLPEKHGDGPFHYSCTMNETVMELYPCSKRHPKPANLRLGFHATKDAFGRLNSSGLLRQPPCLIRQTDSTDIYLVRDPDENAIELEVAA